MSKEDGFKKRLRDCGAVNNEKIAVAASAVAMNGAGHHFLPGSALPGEQYVGVRISDALNDFEQFLHRQHFRQRSQGSAFYQLPRRHFDVPLGGGEPAGPMRVERRRAGPHT